MKDIVNLLFEAKILKEIPRSGYHFLGLGKESVAEHSFMISVIAFVMAQIEEDIDQNRLISMCLVHDLPEARMGDINYVQRKYVTVDENRAIDDMVRNIPFGDHIRSLIDEFNAGETRLSRLAKDADQISFILELKTLKDIGSTAPDAWLEKVVSRLQTDTGKRICEMILGTRWDEWWMHSYSE